MRHPGTSGPQPRASALRDAASALALLTAVPVPARLEPQPRPDAAGWFPLVGALLGLAAAALVLAAEAFASALITVLSAAPRAPAVSDGDASAALAWPLAVCVVGAWALATRFLHWDGLADTADGIGGAREAEERLRIMKDSATGAFGAAAVALAVVAQCAAIAAILASAAALDAKLAIVATAPAVGRLAATFACWFGSPARPGGLGSLVTGRPRLAGAAVAAGVIAACGGALYLTAGPIGLVWIFAGIVFAAAVPHLLASRTGGVTGDIMGASVVVTEALFLLAATMVVVM